MIPKPEIPVSKVAEPSEEPKKFFGASQANPQQASVDPKVAQAPQTQDATKPKALEVIDLNTLEAESATRNSKDSTGRRKQDISPTSDSEYDRIQKEVSIPIPTYERLEQVGYNITDLLKRAYGNHADEVRAGDFLRGVSRGRRRVRLSMSPQDYQKLEKLGRGRGWNRSETVAVLLDAELDKDEYKS